MSFSYIHRMVSCRLTDCMWICLQVSRMYFFLLHLSLADILTAFFSLLPEILWTLTLPEFYGGNLLCRTMKFLQVGLAHSLTDGPKMGSTYAGDFSAFFLLITFKRVIFEN